MLSPYLLECRETKNYELLLKRSQGELKRIVYGVIRRLRPPSSIDENDVLQIVLLAYVEHVDKWDPEKGMEIQNYVVSRCIDRAEKFINKHRRTVGPGGKYRGGPARNDICFSALEKDYDDEYENNPIEDVLLPPTRAIQEDIILANEIIEGANMFGPLFSTFIKTGSLEETANEAMRNQYIREKWKLYKMKYAKKTMQRKIENIVYK